MVCYTEGNTIGVHKVNAAVSVEYQYFEQGPVSLTFFPSQFKFDGNFVLLSPRLHYRDRYKILYMARQLCCRGMCKNLLRSDGQQRSYGKAKFPSYLNCGQKTVSETGPCCFNVVSTISYLIVLSGPIAVTPSFRPSLISNPLWPECVILLLLTHWGRDEMASVLQTTFSIQFREWKFLWSRFHSNIFPGAQSVLSQHLFR